MKFGNLFLQKKLIGEKQHKSQKKQEKKEQKLSKILE